MSEPYQPENGLATLYAEEVRLLGPVESMTATSATTKSYVDSVVQASVTEEKKDREFVDEAQLARISAAEGQIIANDSVQQQQNQFLNGLINDASMNLENENIARSNADVEIKAEIKTESERAVAKEVVLEQEVVVLTNEKLSKSGGTMSGDLSLDNKYLYFSTNWRVSGNLTGSKLTFEHYKADLDQWRVALPFICAV